MWDEGNDTAPDARRAQEAAWRRLGPEGRVRLMLRLSDELRDIAVAGFRSRHPELTEAQARGRMLRAVLGDALYEAAYVSRGRVA
jgi:hypothetical protein